MQEAAAQLYSALWWASLDRYAENVGAAQNVATMDSGEPTMPRKPKLQPFMVYRDDKPSGVSVRARDHEHAQKLARKWLGDGPSTAHPISPDLEPWKLTRQEFNNRYHVHFDVHGVLDEGPTPEARRDSIMQHGLTHGMAAPDINLRPIQDPHWGPIPERAPVRGWATAGYRDNPGVHGYVIPVEQTDANARIKPGTRPVAMAVLSRQGESIHEALVRDAIKAGQRVPAAVLAEYPHLQPAVSSTASAQT